MKKLLLVIVLAVVVLGVLAAPAFASPSSALGFRLTEKTAYIIAYGDGFWFEVTDAGLLEGHRAGEAIPANYDVAMQLSWKGINYGLVQTLPDTFLVKLSIPGLGVDVSDVQARTYWTGAYLWDDYWIDALGPILAFNDSIGAQVYANRWLPPLTGDSGVAANLTADNKLPRGIYTGYYTESLLRTLTSLELSYDDAMNPLKTPYHVRPAGETFTNVFTFKVGPPAK